MVNLVSDVHWWYSPFLAKFPVASAPEIRSWSLDDSSHLSVSLNTTPLPSPYRTRILASDGKQVHVEDSM